MINKLKKFINKIKHKKIHSHMKKNYLNEGVSDKIIFICDKGEYYGGDPKAISELVRKRCRRYEIVWLLKNPSEKKTIVPSYIRTVKIGTKAAYKEMATAKVWVCNELLMPCIYKGRTQIYIQTWHGDRGFKKILMDLDSQKQLIDANICDLMVSGSQFGRKIYNSAFGYNGEIYNFGCPRNDVLVNATSAEIDEAKSRVGIISDKSVKYLLYVPTYVNENNLLDLKKVLDILSVRDNVKWIGLIRFSCKGMNEDVVTKVENSSLNIMDMTKYDDISDLLLVADCLITDYSTCAGDFILRKKAVVLYQPDSEFNEENNYFDIKESPYMVGKNTEEICEILKYLDDEKARNNALAIMKFYETIETGFATRKVVEYINKLDYEDSELLY